VNTNAGSTEHFGFELLTEAKITSELKFKLSQAISQHKFVEYVEKGNDYSGKSISGAPSYTSNAYLTYKPKYLKGFHIGAELQNLLNLRAGYKLKNGLSFWANLLNATDELYANRASSRWGTTYTPGNPRNITIGVRYSIK